MSETQTENEPFIVVEHRTSSQEDGGHKEGSDFWFLSSLDTVFELETSLYGGWVLTKEEGSEIQLSLDVSVPRDRVFVRTYTTEISEARDVVLRYLEVFRKLEKLGFPKDLRHKLGLMAIFGLSEKEMNVGLQTSLEHLREALASYEEKKKSGMKFLEILQNVLITRSS